jgi:flagellar operon protein
MRARSIHLSQQEEVELARAIDAASAKGARESLILLDDLALVVSVRNRLVITALEQRAGEPSVFTHIDSAVLLRRASKEM